jgi:hypothetical protein
MLGKSTLENYPGSLEQASQPLGRVHMDSYSSSLTLVEGYNHSIIFTDSNSGFRWQYGMKTKDETLNMSINMSKRWYVEISDVGEKYSLIMIVRDNSGENTSKEFDPRLSQPESGSAQTPALRVRALAAPPPVHNSGCGLPRCQCPVLHRRRHFVACISARSGPPPMLPHDVSSPARKPPMCSL